MSPGTASSRPNAVEWERLPSSVERIAFVTPPTARPVLRDYYSTSRSKGAYLWAPVDLWVQGAMLGTDVDTRIFEGAGRSADSLLGEIRAYAPDVVVMLIGGFCEGDDAAFADRLWLTAKVPVVVGGEAVMRGWSYWSSRPWAAGLLWPFIGTQLRDRLLGRPLPTAAPAAGRHRWGQPPNWPLTPYRYPLLGDGVPSVLTSHGCPFRCAYCNNNRDLLGLDLRDEDDLFTELDTWAARGVRRIHVRDVNFAGPAPRAKALLRAWAARRYPFRWNCFLRPETIDDEMADLLHDAGCVQVQMGVESANSKVLAGVRRGGGQDAVAGAFRRLDRRGIRRGAHFVLGLPRETEADLARTVELACRLDPDYASFNIGVIRAGTTFDGEPGDCSSGQGALIGGLPRSVVVGWQRRAVRSVYLRPAFAFRTLRSLIRDPELLASVCRDGCMVARRGALDTFGLRS